MHLPGGYNKSNKRRKRGRSRGRVGREVCAWIQVLVMRMKSSVIQMPMYVPLGHLVRGLLIFFLISVALVCLLPSESLPSSYNRRNPHVRGAACANKPLERPKLGVEAYCTGECNSECFPRVSNICFAADKIRICELPGAGGLSKRDDLPKFMRFFGEKLTVPVGYDSSCSKGWHWISGLSLVADQRFLPAGKPNPHHEAEKLIPAILLKQLNQSANLQWFAEKTDVSVWGKGLLQAFKLKEVRFHTLPSRTDDSICFEDAVLFSRPTHVNYIPNMETNSQLRSTVLKHCSIEAENSSWPVSRAVVLDRISGSRRLADKLEIGKLMARVLGVPVEQRGSGVGDFCEQVRRVATDDFFLVPHGSQNVNFLFARPGSVVIEVFPYLFHTDVFQNYTHATGIDVYPLLGIRPPANTWMRIFSLLGWDICFNNVRWCKNYARQQSLYVNFLQLERLIRSIQMQRSAFRTQLGW